MLGIDRKAVRYTWTAALILLLLVCVYLIRESLVVFSIAVLLTYLLYPLFEMLKRVLPGKSRAPALAVVYLTVFGLLGLIVMTVGSRVAEEARSLSAKVPAILNQVEINPDEAPAQGTPKSLEAQVINELRAQLVLHYSQLVALVPQYSIKVLSVSRYLLLIIVIPIMSFFMLKDGAALREDLIDLFAPGRDRELIEDVLNDIHVLLLQYMRALFTLCMAVFGSFALALSLMGVPYALLLATVAFALEFVPLVGPLSSAVIIMAVATFAGFPHLFLLLAFLGLYRLFQDYVLSPNLMAAGVELRPLIVILGVLAGGEIGGAAGIFLSVPVLAMARIIIRHIRKHRIHSPEHVAVG